MKARVLIALVVPTAWSGRAAAQETINYASVSGRVLGATEAWVLQNNEFVRCGEALPAGSTHLIERPLLEALTQERSPVLLIDELDRADEPFDAFLLEVLAENQLTIPELGTIKASAPPKARIAQVSSATDTTPVRIFWPGMA